LCGGDVLILLRRLAALATFFISIEIFRGKTAWRSLK
jgi:hypothetical protein